MNKFMIPLFLSLAFLLSSCGGKQEDSRAVITVKTNPEGAFITISGKDCGKAPVSGKISPGSILLKAELPGYEPVWQRVVLESKKKKDVLLELAPITSSIMLKTTPEVPAEVTFNGKKYGQTPIVISGLVSGNYTASLKAPGYASAQVSWNIDSKRPQMKIVKLFSNTGVLRLEKGPENAVVKINGAVYGELPCEFSLEQGEYTLEISAPGYNPFIREISLKSNGKEVIQPVFTELPGKLVINSNPSGALVRINGKEYGSAPLTVEDMKAGKVRVEFSLDKYEPVMIEQAVAPGKTLSITGSLTSSLGSIEFVTMPAGVMVYLDNQKLGETEPDPAHKGFSKVFRIKEVAPGIHTLKFIHKLATPSEKILSVRVEKNKNTRLEKNVELWIANARITHSVGTKYIGRIVSENDEYIKFEPKPGSRIDYKRSELISIERFPGRE